MSRFQDYLEAAKKVPTTDHMNDGREKGDYILNLEFTDADKKKAAKGKQDLVEKYEIRHRDKVYIFWNIKRKGGNYIHTAERKDKPGTKVGNDVLEELRWIVSEHDKKNDPYRNTKWDKK